VEGRLTVLHLPMTKLRGGRQGQGLRLELPEGGEIERIREESPLGERLRSWKRSGKAGIDFGKIEEGGLGWEPIFVLKP